VFVQELCYYGIFTLFYFICGIVSAVNGYRDGAVVAATVSISDPRGAVVLDGIRSQRMKISLSTRSNIKFGIILEEPP